jgi:DNA uptake protein ComE-like DNA-binding protein
LGAAAAAEPTAQPQSPVPAAGQAPATSPHGVMASPHGMPGAKPAAKTPPVPPKRVDINNASLEQIKTGLQLGDAQAKKIIEHRPYKAKGELMTKAGLPEGMYMAIKDRVELQKPRKAAATK